MALIIRMLVPLVLVANLSQASPAIAAGIDARPKPSEGFSYPEIYCTNRGVRVEVEDTSCLNVDGKNFVAVCDLSLNNPMWRPTGKSCEPNVTSDILPASSD